MKQTVTINASPHVGQARVFKSPARFKVLASGRRWGKTRLGVNICLDDAARGKRAWWVAPTYKMSEVGWRPLKVISQRIPGVVVNKSERKIQFPSGGEIVVRSADNPNSLRGEGLDRVVLDECAYIDESAWTEALRPALSDRKGGALFISTPKGLNWFYRLFQLGQGADTDWESWRMPTSMNPFIDSEEIETVRKSVPERVFRQEFLAEFISDGAYFQNIDAASVIEEFDPPEKHGGHFIVGGADWAISNDYTVITLACRDCNRVIYWDRFNQIDFSYQRERVIDACTRYNVDAFLPERNTGEANIEILIQRGINVLFGQDGKAGFFTSPATKPKLIQDLASALEHFGFLVPVEYADELRTYEIESLTGGYPRFSAPSGMHDDRVISLALAWHALVNVPRIEYTDDPFERW